MNGVRKDIVFATTCKCRFQRYVIGTRYTRLHISRSQKETSLSGDLAPSFSRLPKKNCEAIAAFNTKKIRASMSACDLLVLTYAICLLPREMFFTAAVSALSLLRVIFCKVFATNTSSRYRYSTSRE